MTSANCADIQGVTGSYDKKGRVGKGHPTLFELRQEPVSEDVGISLSPVLSLSFLPCVCPFLELPSHILDSNRSTVEAGSLTGTSGALPNDQCSLW